MKPTAQRVDSLSSRDMEIICGAIRGVSAMARVTTIRSDSLLLEDLALDSLDLVAVILRLQDEYGVEIDPDEITTLRTVEDLVAVLDRQLRKAA